MQARPFSFCPQATSAGHTGQLFSMSQTHENAGSVSCASTAQLLVPLSRAHGAPRSPRRRRTGRGRAVDVPLTRAVAMLGRSCVRFPLTWLGCLSLTRDAPLARNDALRPPGLGSPFAALRSPQEAMRAQSAGLVGTHSPRGGGQQPKERTMSNDNHHAMKRLNKTATRIFVL